MRLGRDTCPGWASLTEAERKLALDGLGLLAYAAEMEMKSRSLGKSWNTKNPK